MILDPIDHLCRRCQTEENRWNHGPNRCKYRSSQRAETGDQYTAVDRYGPLDALVTFLQSRCWISKTKDGPISNMLVYRSFQIQKRKEIVKAVHLSSNTQEDIHLSQYLLDLPIVETHNPNVESALEQHFCYVIFSQKTGGVSFWHFEKEPYFKAAWGYYDSYLLRECDIPCFFCAAESDVACLSSCAQGSHTMRGGSCKQNLPMMRIWWLSPQI